VNKPDAELVFAQKQRNAEKKKKKKSLLNSVTPKVSHIVTPIVSLQKFHIVTPSPKEQLPILETDNNNLIFDGSGNYFPAWRAARL